MDHAERILGPLLDLDDQILSAGRRVTDEDGGRITVVDTYCLEKMPDDADLTMGPSIQVTQEGLEQLIKLLSIVGDGTFYLKTHDACVQVSLIDNEVTIDEGSPDSFEVVEHSVSFGRNGVN